MKRVKTALFALALTLTASGAVFARAPTAVINFVDEPAVTTSGKALPVEQLTQLVTKVARAKNWIVAPARDGRLNASLSWKNNKHTIMVEIVCAANSFSIHYKNSVNMNYEVLDGQPVIHPYYNRYVNDLRNAIQAEILRQ